MFQNIDIAILEMLNGSSSSFVDGLMLTLTSGVTWIPLYVALLYLVIYNSDSMTKICLTVGAAVLCVLLSGGVSDLIVKPLVGRLRPVNDPLLHDIIHTVNGLYSKDYSFFSSHAANTMSLALFFSLLVRNSKICVALVVWSLTNCYTRLYLGMHYPSDIIAGILWGSIVAVGVYCIYQKLYSRIYPDVEFVSTQYTSQGYTIETIDIVILTLTLTYMYAVIRALII